MVNHVNRREEKNLGKIVRVRPKQREKGGRPKNTWEETIKKDLGKLSIKEELWRMQEGVASKDIKTRPSSMRKKGRNMKQRNSRFPLLRLVLSNNHL